MAEWLWRCVQDSPYPSRYRFVNAEQNFAVEQSAWVRVPLSSSAFCLCLYFFYDRTIIFFAFCFLHVRGLKTSICWWLLRHFQH
ncbi:hypothetical protein F5X97DRAFT_286501 [Nemania serpens]|nr:hypothetical protein F5X97DRAFT_286501 [Nemania serpens]